MNKVMLIGRLTAKPELRYTNSNIPYTRFTVAVNRIVSKDGNRETDFIPVIVWRKQAENVCNYLDKGAQVAVEGKIQTGSYDDKDGNKRYTTDIVADNVQFLESKSARNNNIDTSSPYDYQPEPIYQGGQTNDVNINDDDPFAEFGDSVSIDDNFLE